MNSDHKFWAVFVLSVSLVFGIIIWGVVQLDGPPPDQGANYSWVQELPDGRSVVCVGIQSSGPAISCDWSNAR